MVAAVGVGQEGLAALGGPLDRPADALAGPHQRGLLAVEEDLRAEAAADIGCDDAHLVLRDAEHEGAHQQPLDVRVLVGDVQRVVVVGRVVAGVGGARLDRVRHQPVVAKAQLADVRRLREGGVGAGAVADRPVVAKVVGCLVVHHRAAAGRCLRLRDIDHRRQLFIVDLDHRRRVLRLLQRLGDHQRDAVADIAHLRIGQDRMLRLLHRRAVDAVDEPAARQPAYILELLAGEDAQHAGCGLRGGDVDLRQPGVRVGAAHEHAVALLRQRDVVGVLAAAGQEAQVFAARHRLADQLLGCVHRALLQAFIAAAPCCTALTMLW